MSNPLKSLQRGDLNHLRVTVGKPESSHIADPTKGEQILRELPARLKPFTKKSKLRRKISKT